MRNLWLGLVLVASALACDASPPPTTAEYDALERDIAALEATSKGAWFALRAPADPGPVEALWQRLSERLVPLNRAPGLPHRPSTQAQEFRTFPEKRRLMALRLRLSATQHLSPPVLLHELGQFPGSYPPAQVETLVRKAYPLLRLEAPLRGATAVKKVGLVFHTRRHAWVLDAARTPKKLPLPRHGLRNGILDLHAIWTGFGALELIFERRTTGASGVRRQLLPVLVEGFGGPRHLGAIELPDAYASYSFSTRTGTGSDLLVLHKGQGAQSYIAGLYVRTPQGYRSHPSASASPFDAPRLKLR